jgi:hypothetical protein
MRFHVFGLIAALILGVRSIDAQIPGSGSSSSCLDLVRKTYQLLEALSGRTFEHFGETFPFIPRSDGGDGGGGDGSGGDGSGGDGTGGDGTGDSGDGNGDGPSGDTGTVGNQGDPGSQGDQGDPGSQGDPGEQGDPAQTDPTTTPANLSTVANPNDVPTDDPALGLRGPGSPGAGFSPDAETFNFLPGGSASGVGEDVGINAVIVSGAPTPWDAIGKGPGVRFVTVTGGIIALGEVPLNKPSAGISVGARDNPPIWLTLRPDLRYLNGSAIPPIVPNVIDIRIISFTEQVIEYPFN